MSETIAPDGKADKAEQADKAEIREEYALDAAPEKVWRAISIPAFREHWLPEKDLAEAEPVTSEEGKEVRYKIRDDTPPYLESMVRFQIRPDNEGGTILTIIHQLTDARLAAKPIEAANSNSPLMMLAA